MTMPVVAEPVFAHAVAAQAPVVMPEAPPPPSPMSKCQQQIPPPINRSRPPSLFGGSTRDSHLRALVGAVSDEEDPVAQWVPPARETSEITASINVECVPELPEVSVDGQSTFHAVVSLFSTESASGQAARTETARPPMDLVCVLDTSGSMGSDNKLVNLKHAGERKHMWL
jgi:hypothetical protein